MMVGHTVFIRALECFCSLSQGQRVSCVVSFGKCAVRKVWCLIPANYSYVKSILEPNVTLLLIFS